MEDTLKLKIKENQKFILAIICTVMFSLIIVFLITSNTGVNKETKQLKSIGSKLNKVNQSLNDGIHDFSIDTKKSDKLLSDGAITLKDLAFDLSAITTTSESTTSLKDELINALSTTIALYDYSVFIINNPEKIVSDENISELISYKDECSNSYSILTDRGIDISFSNDNIVFFDNIVNYLNTLLKLNKTQNIINAQKRDFIDSLKNLIPSLDILTENLEPALNKIKEDKRDLQGLIDDVESKEILCKDVQNKLVSSSIPDGYGDYYTSLDEFLKLYNPYMSTFKNALIYDKSTTDKVKNKSQIADNYKNSFSKYEDALTSYSKFKELLNK
ncbi:MAG: hypothetical protein ACRDA5_10645 [Clostridium sp.]